VVVLPHKTPESRASKFKAKHPIKKGRRIFVMQLQRELHDLAKYCSRLVALTIHEDVTNKQQTAIVNELEKLRSEWQKWRFIYIEEYASMQQGKPMTLGAQIVTELTHIWGLLNRPLRMQQIYDTDLSIAQLLHPSWIATIHSYGKPSPFPWEVPIDQYTQSQTVFVAMFLSQHFNLLSEGCVGEFKAAFDALWCRMATLSQEWHDGTLLDEVGMRTLAKDQIFIVNVSYREFCHCYMGTMMRALFYHDQFRERRMSFRSVYVQGTRTWLEHIVKLMASEAFEDMYVSCCEEAYCCSGDDLWFKHAYPTKVHSRAECLLEMRPHLYQPFFSESKTTKATALAKYNQDGVARLFMLKAISSYIQAKSAGEFDWFLTVIRASEDLITETSFDFQIGQQAPLLYAALGYWPYHNGSFYICDDLAESVAVWFAMCERYYDGHICGRDMRPFWNEIQRFEQRASSEEQGFFVEDN
jgi:hypothetical protein